MRKNPEERCIDAANSILFINCSDRADHSFEELRCERSLAAGFQNAAPHLAEMALYFPDGTSRYQGSDEQSYYTPGYDRFSRTLLHRDHALEDFVVFALHFQKEIIQFFIHRAKLLKALETVASGILREFNVGLEIVAQLTPRLFLGEWWRI